MSSSNLPDREDYIYNSQLDAFTLYHLSRHTSSHNAVGPALPALGHALSGACGTAVSKLLTYPLDIVITRLQVQRQVQRNSPHPHYDGILDAVEKIYEREGGLQAFYNGVFHETAKGIADSFLFFLAYSYVRERRLVARGSGQSLPALEEIGVGVVAGAFSKFFTTPIQNIVTRKQTAAMLSHQDSGATIPPLSSTRDIAWEIKHEKGWQGFWSGYSASLVLTLNPSITMLLHKFLLQLLVPRASREDPGARTTFLLAAVSKALASTVTYPFSLAKTRAQVSSQKPTATQGETSELKDPTASSHPRSLQARKRTVFSTILRIAQTEGLWALYEGLGAEVLKGFFSHGITMLMKDRIHSTIISLYYTVVQSLKKLPNPGEVAKTATDEAKHVYEQGKEQVSDVYAKGVEVANNAADKVKEAVTEGSQQAQNLAEKGAEHAGGAASTMSSTAQSATQSGVHQAGNLFSQSRDAASGATQRAGDVLEKGKEAASNAVQSAQEAASSAAQTVQETASNATRQAKDAVLEANVRDIDGPETGIKE
ncbi:mitochondrial carrier [Plenodomus tracheiphilus IPT5]|uniref:Mitochondrial carrier n=1 Tax=Plenodomus tracheiphilus IPT5 TaxID=1408161 RepID=A0A6A7BEL3_9PLEO|nr:mitochondrial carrier [Plenodomus tracheiphilus IPT5]